MVKNPERKTEVQFFFFTTLAFPSANLPGVLPPPRGVFDVGVLGLRDIDLLAVFIGVLLDVLVLTEQFIIMDSFFDALTLSFSLRCHLIWGPLQSGASILNALLMSFSKLKWDISTLWWLDGYKCMMNDRQDVVNRFYKREKCYHISNKK